MRWMLGLMLVCLLGSVRAWSDVAEPPELVIYTYDSFVAKSGMGPAIFPLFEKKCGCKVRPISVGDAGQLLNRLQLDSERHANIADVVVGLDLQSWERAQPYLESWSMGPFKNRLKLKGLESLRTEIRSSLPVEIGKTFVPFDFGVYAFMADMEALQSAKLQAPTRLVDLLQPQWRRNVLLEDPRTSGPGLAFVLYVQAIQLDPSNFWKNFRTQWLTLAPGWDAAYALFLKKEAPLVWSYTTSQAYHQEHGDHGRYRALIFNEGHAIQVEGAALVRRALPAKSQKKQQVLARSFLEFMISPTVQNLVPLKNWMLPVRKDTQLPTSFKNLPKPSKIIQLPTHASEIEKTLLDWQAVISR